MYWYWSYKDQYFTLYFPSKNEIWEFLRIDMTTVTIQALKSRSIEI